MTTPVRAPQRTPVRRPAAAPETRPALRVVTAEDERRAARRFAGPAAVVLGGALLFGLLFALAAFHAVLMQGQERLDRLSDEVAEEQARYEQLRLELAQLESPDRIVAEATTRLGMVPAENTTYLTPSGAVEAEIAEAAAATETSGAAGADQSAAPDGADGADAATGPSAWGEVKPYLGESP